MPDERSYKGTVDASEILGKIERGEDVDFDGYNITDNLDIHGRKLPEYYGKQVINSKISIKNSHINGFVRYSDVIFKKEIDFPATIFDGRDEKGVSADFQSAIFYGAAFFVGATFSNDADFKFATFSAHADFDMVKIEGDILTFREAKFAFPYTQENACRKAKNALAKAGNRDEEEYHFYREMEAKRIQKGIRGNSGLGLGHWLKTDTWSFWKFFWYDFFEYLFIQRIFGYGVHPWWLIAWWSIIVALFAILYWAGNGIEGAVNALDYIKISLAAAIAPGYIAVIINPSSTGYKLAPAYQLWQLQRR